MYSIIILLYICRYPKENLSVIFRRYSKNCLSNTQMYLPSLIGVVPLGSGIVIH